MLQLALDEVHKHVPPAAEHPLLLLIHLQGRAETWRQQGGVAGAHVAGNKAQQL